MHPFVSLLLLACTGEDGASTDAAPDWGRDSGEADDTHTADTDTADTGDSGDTAAVEPTWAFEDGNTGIRFDLSYDGTVGGSDVVRIGLFGSPNRSGGALTKLDVTAIFPKSIEVPISLADFPAPDGAEYDGAVYVAAYIDRNNDHYHYPGPEDLVIIYGPGGGLSWDIPVYRNKLTTGAELAFKDPY